MAQPPNPYDSLPPVPSFTVRSDDVSDGQTLDTPFLSGAFGMPGGEDRFPHLAWEGFPAETKSFAVTCYDPDAPTASGFWHWAAFNIPASVTELSSSVGSESGEGLPAGAVVLKNDAGVKQFIGAAPPTGTGPHRYFFTVHAVDVESLEIPGEASPAFLGFNLFSHTLARAAIVPVYENKG